MIDIVVRSFFRDFEWLRLCLDAISLHVTGFGKLVLVLPRSSLARRPAWLDALPNWVELVASPDERNDYVGQQITKLYADRVSDAPVIVHLDSDCIVDRPCDLEQMFLRDGRCRLRFRRQTARPSADGWRRGVEHFFGQACEVDFLAPLPIAFPRRLYPALRQLCRDRHRCELDEWARRQRPDLLSEFSLLGTLAWFGESDDVVFECIDDETGWPCINYWSRRDLPADARLRFAAG